MKLRSGGAQTVALTGSWVTVLLAVAAGVAFTTVARNDMAPFDMASNTATALGAAGFATLGALIVRRAHNVIGWVMLAEGAALACLALGSGYAIAGVATLPGSLPGAKQAGALAQGSFGLVGFGVAFMFLLFPSGRLPSRRWLPAAAAGSVLTALTTVGLALRPGQVGLPAPDGGSLSVPNPLGRHDPGPVLRGLLIQSFPGMVAALAVFFIAALVLLRGRYRDSGEVLRQQVKWLGLIAAVIGIALLLDLVGGAAGHRWAWLATTGNIAVEVSVLFGIPIAMTLAILKHRLFDIDRIVSRTLAYAIVTGLLLGFYAGLVLLATEVLRFHGSVAVAGSTLVAAALFTPLRHRVQWGVDRRFNRARYDAERTVAAFAARMKDVVDSDSVRDDLATAAYSALEPAHVSVWLSDRQPH